MARSRRIQASGQLTFSFLTSAPESSETPSLPRGGRSRRTQADVGHDDLCAAAVRNNGFCLGTTHCLCGQQELSDSPLWVEEDN